MKKVLFLMVTVIVLQGCITIQNCPEKILIVRDTVYVPKIITEKDFYVDDMGINLDQGSRHPHEGGGVINLVGPYCDTTTTFSWSQKDPRWSCDTTHFNREQFPLPPSFKDYKVHEFKNGKIKYWYRYYDKDTYSIWRK